MCAAWAITVTKPRPAWALKVATVVLTTEAESSARRPVLMTPATGDLGAPRSGHMNGNTCLTSGREVYTGRGW